MFTTNSKCSLQFIFNILYMHVNRGTSSQEDGCIFDDLRSLGNTSTVELLTRTCWRDLHEAGICDLKLWRDMWSAGKFSTPTLRKLYFISIHIEWDMIVVTVFLLILNQMEFHLVENWKENCHHDHIPFNVKGNGNIVFSVLNWVWMTYRVADVSQHSAITSYL